MWEWIKCVLNSPEFISTIMGSFIGGIVTILMFFCKITNKNIF